MAQSVYQQYQTNWQQRQAWATNQGINRNVWDPIMQMDQHRLQSGLPIMSNYEFNRDILTSMRGYHVTQAPQISTGNVVGNWFSDFRNFYSGLANIVVHPMGSFVDPVLHGIEHLPNSFMLMAKDLARGDLRDMAIAMGHNELLSLFPGVTDISNFAEGGWRELADHPFFSVIDVAPWGKILGRAGMVAGRLPREVGEEEGRIAEMTRAAKRSGFYGAGRVAARETVGRFPLGKGRMLGGPEGEIAKAFRALGIDLESRTAQRERGELSRNVIDSAQKVLTEINKYIADKDPQFREALDLIRVLGWDHAPDELKAIPGMKEAFDFYNFRVGTLRDLSPDTGRWVDLGSAGMHWYNNSEADTIEAEKAAMVQADNLVSTIQQQLLDLSRERAQQITIADTASQWTGHPSYTERQAGTATPTPTRTVTGRVGGKPAAAQVPAPMFRIIAQHLSDLQVELRHATQSDELIQATYNVSGKVAKRKLNELQVAVDKAVSLATADKYSALRSALSEIDRIISGKTFQLSLPILGLRTQIRDFRRMVNNWKTLGDLNRKVHLHIAGNERDIRVLQNQLRDASRDAMDLQKNWNDEFLARHAPHEWDDLFVRAAKMFYIFKRTEQYAANPQLHHDLDLYPSDLVEKVGALHGPWTADSLRNPNTVVSMLQLGNWLFQHAEHGNPTTMLEQEFKKLYDPTLGLEGDRLYQQYFEDATHTWQQLRELGWQPLYKPRVTDTEAQRAMHPALTMTRGTQLQKPSFVRERTTRWAVNKFVHDPGLSLYTATAQILAYNALVSFHKNYVSNLAKRLGNPDTVLKEWNIAKQHVIPKEMHDDPAVEARYFSTWLRQNYVEYNPEKMHLRATDAQKIYRAKLGGGEEGEVAGQISESHEDRIAQLYLQKNMSNDILLIPKFIIKGLQTIEHTETVLPGKVSLSRGNRIFKTTLLTLSPRYLVHMSIGQAFMTTVKYGPGYVRYLGNAIGLMRNGQMDVHTMAMMHTAYDDLAVPMFEVASGSKQGRLLQHEWMDAAGLDPEKDPPWKIAINIAHRYHNFVATVNNAQRIALVLHLEHRLEKKPYRYNLEPESYGHIDPTYDDITPERYQAIQLAAKVFGNVNSFSPIEALIARNLIPFYSWTRTVLSYALMLPAENPYRVELLGAISQMEMNQWGSSMPLDFRYLFYLGNPDPAGNVTAIDVRGIDPMRDVGTYFTLAGFISTFTPFLSGAAQFVGIDPLTANPSLYPTLDYNQFYGTLQPKRDVSDGVFKYIEGIVPQSQALDYALGFSTQMKQLRAGNSKGFAYSLMTYLNFPYLPQHRNVRQELIRTENDVYSVLNSKVTAALQSGNFSDLMGYNAVPYRGWDVNPQRLAILAGELSKTYGVPASEVINSIVPAAPVGQGVWADNPALTQAPFPGAA